MYWTFYLCLTLDNIFTTTSPITLINLWTIILYSSIFLILSLSDNHHFMFIVLLCTKMSKKLLNMKCTAISTCVQGDQENYTHIVLVDLSAFLRPRVISWIFFKCHHLVDIQFPRLYPSANLQNYLRKKYNET